MLSTTDERLREIRDQLIARSEDLEPSARMERAQIERALERLEAGVYGLCDQCGAPVEAARLRIAPDACACRSCLAVG
jgi:RNA polymerase-binding transcription factor DksA